MGRSEKEGVEEEKDTEETFHLLAVLVRPAERLDDEALAAVQAVGQVLLVAGLEVLRVQRRDGRRRCGTNRETGYARDQLPTRSGSFTSLSCEGDRRYDEKQSHRISPSLSSQHTASRRALIVCLDPGPVTRRKMDGGQVIICPAVINGRSQSSRLPESLTPAQRLFITTCTSATVDRRELLTGNLLRGSF